MRGQSGKYLLLLTFISMQDCRKPYEPPAIKASNHFVAVDGFINTGGNNSSTFIINRSLNLTDSVMDLPELGCIVNIQSESGVSYPMTDTGMNGTYVSEVLNLDPAIRYRLSVKTSDGNEYQSDFITSKPAPPIDSVGCELSDDEALGSQALNVYVNAHDPSNNTRFYRWDYVETWQHSSFYQSAWGLTGDILHSVVLIPEEQTYQCWSTQHSSTILLGSSVALSSDVISQMPVAKFLKDDPRLDIEYSILVRQYPLDAQAYAYWLNVQKNSQTLGGLFDLQPSQMKGNLHSVTNPSDPVFGYVSASSITEKRLFISNKSLPGWKYSIPYSCPTKLVAPPDPANMLHWNYSDTAWALYYFSNGIPVIAQKFCLDCRYQGGTTVKPAFWQ